MDAATITLGFPETRPAAFHAAHGSARSWPQDFPFDNGQYSNACLDCGGLFMGGKYRRTCRLCSQRGNPLNHVVSFSGGACSFWAAARVVERYGAENVTLLFADTKMEDEDLYRFLRDAVQHLGVPLTTIADGRTPWQVFSDEGMMGNSRTDLCSRILKRELLDQWHRANCLEMTTTLYVGIDWTEEHRLHRLRARKPGWRIEAPMCEAPLWDKCRMNDELRKIGIEPPRLYKLGFPHNNCGGFCIKAGQAHFAHLLKVMPERYAQHEANEEAMRARLGDVSVMKDRRGGTTATLTMKMLRERIGRGESFDRSEWGGCGCAIDAPQEQNEKGQR